MREECTSFAEKLTGLFSDIVFKTMSVQLLRDLDELDVTLSQLQALSFIAERRCCSVGALAEGLGVTHPAAVKLVDKLVKKELITRSVAATDHRQTDIVVTETGRELVKQVRRARTDRLEAVLSRMPAEDRHALIDGLQGFVTAALQDESCLDALCLSCQALLPTDCTDFRLITEEQLSTSGTGALPWSEAEASDRASITAGRGPDGGRN